MNLSIIIPNFNGKKLLGKNLPKVLEAGKDCEIIIVDDASVDGSVEFLKTEFPSIKILSTNSLVIPAQAGIHPSRNKGFSSSVNLGVKHAKSDLVFLLNSDCYPEKNSIGKVMMLFKDESLFAVGLAQKSQEFGKTIIWGRGLGKFEKGFFLHSYGSPDKTTTQWVSGGAGIFRKSIWEKLGGMDEIYNPFYWEDIDLSYQALKSGYSIMFEPDAYVVHDQQEGSIRSHYSKSYVEAISYRNQFLFVWLNISDPTMLVNHFFYLLYRVLKSLFASFWQGLSGAKDASRIGLSSDFAFLRGYVMSKLKFLTAMRKRMKRKKLWKKKDTDCVVKG